MSIVIGMIVLGFLLIATVLFGLGWTWPLIAGIMKRRRGTGGNVLIVVGSVWLACVLISALTVVGGGIWLLSRSQEWKTPEFNPAEYNGATAKLISLPDSTARLTAESENGSFNFTASNGVFTVPAGKLRPESYSITKKDKTGNEWTASWFYYGITAAELNLEPFSEEPIKSAPPLTMTATRVEADNGDQSIDIQIVDRNGDSVGLRSSQKPAIEIVNAAGSVVWSRALSYG